MPESSRLRGSVTPRFDVDRRRFLRLASGSALLAEAGLVAGPYLKFGSPVQAHEGCDSPCLEVGGIAHPHCDDARGNPLLIGTLYQHTEYFCYDDGLNGDTVEHPPIIKSCGITAHRLVGPVVCGINTNRPDCASEECEENPPRPDAVRLSLVVRAVGSEPELLSLSSDENPRPGYPLGEFRERFGDRGVITDPWGNEHRIPFKSWSGIDSEGHSVVGGFEYPSKGLRSSRTLTSDEVRRIEAFRARVK